MFSLNDLAHADHRPLPYEQGEEFWNDPYISKKLLEAHLSSETEAASFTMEKRQAVCNYLMQAMKLQTGDPVVDLGCGPGLYCSILAQNGIKMTGIDYSENSIRYAREQNYDTPVNFIHNSYLNPFGANEYTAAMMIYEDYGVLNPDNRKLLLKNIYDALQSKGFLALDVSSEYAFECRINQKKSDWYASNDGLWRPHSHFVLQKSFFYSNIWTSCDLYAVYDTAVSFYNIWQTFFNLDRIRIELEESGFRIEKMLSDLTGKPYRNDSPVIGVICSKV